MSLWMWSELEVSGFYIYKKIQEKWYTPNGRVCYLSNKEYDIV